MLKYLKGELKELKKINQQSNNKIKKLLSEINKYEMEKDQLKFGGDFSD